MNKVYIAAPFFNEDQLEVVTNIENILERSNINFHSPRRLGVIKDMSNKERQNAAKKIFKSNIDAMLECSAIICVIDNFDAGTIFELGYMKCMKNFAIDVKIITYSADGHGLNVMLAEASDCHLKDLTKLPLAFTGGISDKAKSVI